MTDDVEAIEPDDGSVGTAVCPKCMAEVAPSVDFCPECRAPLTPFANTGYLESALSEGWGIGEAIVTKTPSPVILIGLWLLLGPVLIGGVLLLVAFREPDWTWDRALGTLMLCGVVCGVGWCLARATRNYVRTRRHADADEPESDERGDAGFDAKADPIRSSVSRVLDVAQAILRGDVGVIEGSRALSALRHEVCSSDLDPDFAIFVAIDDQTDHLPTTKDRHLWAQDALDQLAPEIARFEVVERDAVLVAARRLVGRFGGQT